jgi:hypothetical protein
MPDNAATALPSLPAKKGWTQDVLASIVVFQMLQSPNTAAASS